MKRKSVILFFTLVTLFAFLNGTFIAEAEDRDVKTELESLYGLWGSALKNKDLVAIEKLLNPGFTAEQSGLTYNRQKVTDELKSQLAGEDTTDWEASIDELTVKEDRASAAVSTREFYTAALPEGAPMYRESRYLDTWVYKAEGWKLEHRKQKYTANGMILPAQTEIKYDSPRLSALAKELKSGKATATEEFWKDMDGKAPLIEPIANDEENFFVTYLWRSGKEIGNVLMFGGYPTGDFQKTLLRMPDTDIFYLTERIPKDARYIYNFVVTKSIQKPPSGNKESETVTVAMNEPDPLNPNYYVFGSVCELPGASPQPWSIRLPGVAPGQLKDHIIKSSILKQDRKITIYTPVGYKKSEKPYGLVVFFDGILREPAIPAADILDNLIAKGIIPAVVAATIHNISGKTRSPDLSCSKDFADFLATEMVPWIRKNYNVSSDPQQTTIQGISLGGLMSFYVGLKHSEVFGNVLAQSSSLWYYPEWLNTTLPPHSSERGWLSHQYALSPKLNLRIWMEVGRYETDYQFDMIRENRRMRDVLEAKGYPVAYSEYHGGHDYVTWRGTLADGLIALLGKNK